VEYEINPTLSRFTIKVHAAGMLSAFGHSPTIAVRDFTGRVTLSNGEPERAGVELTINAASLSVAGDVKESDRREIERTMYKDVLEVDRYPTITFAGTEATGVAPNAGSFRANVVGTLTVHGVSSSERIEALVNVMGDRLTANGQITIRQSQYDIKPVSIAGGAIKLKDEIELSFDLVARATQK
jgi:polyisoprenoid-binding protein YceI